MKRLDKLKMVLGIAILVTAGATLILAQPPSRTLSQGVELTPMAYLPYVALNARSGTPYGAMHFGDDPSDYDHPKAEAFNGGFVDLSFKTDFAMQTVLQAAQDHEQTILINVTDSYPCKYWDGNTFDHDQFVSDVTSKVDNVVPFYPGTVIGLLLLNEPHDPQPECQPGIPPVNLYNAAKEIRAAFAAEGAGNILIGFGSDPSYIEAGLTAAQAQDGTINLSMLQWSPSRGDYDTWAAPHQAAAARMSAGGSQHWIVYSVNGQQSTDQQVIDMNTWACQQSDAIEVWWYNWAEPSGPKATISLAEFLAVRVVCDAND